MYASSIILALAVFGGGCLAGPLSQRPFDITNLPISQESTLSIISCTPTPPFSTSFEILKDPYQCLSLCGLQEDSSAIVRLRRPYLNSRGLHLTMYHEDGDDDYEMDLAPAEREYDCICAKYEDIAADGEVESIDQCGENDWIVYTPLRDSEGNPALVDGGKSLVQNNQRDSI